MYGSKSFLSGPLLYAVIACILLLSSGCASLPFNLPGQATSTPASPPPVATARLVVVTATSSAPSPTVQSQAPTATSIATQSAPPPTIEVQVVPLKTPSLTPNPAAGGTAQVKIFLIAVGDNGVSGPKIGCGDSAVGVIRVIPATKAPLTAALNELLGLHEQHYGQSGLYNSLYNSHLQLQSVAVTDGVALIKLTGTLSLGGECDDPRVDAQITNTALQFATVKSVDVSLNGKPLKEVLSGK